MVLFPNLIYLWLFGYFEPMDPILSPVLRLLRSSLFGVVVLERLSGASISMYMVLEFTQVLFPGCSVRVSGLCVTFGLIKGIFPQLL